MKKLFQIAATILLLSATVSMNPFADTTNPWPDCPPSICPVS